MVDFRYGIFESNPTAYNKFEAWVLIENDWVKFMPGEVRMGVRPATEAEVIELNGGRKLPSLPPDAFTRI